MYIITVEFRIRAGHEARFLARTHEQADRSLSGELGCLQFDVCRDPADPGRVFLYEVYSDKAAFRVHLESAHFRDFDSATTDWIESKTVSTWYR